MKRLNFGVTLATNPTPRNSRTLQGTASPIQ